MAVGLFAPVVPPVLKVALVGVCAGVLQGAVIGSEVAYAPSPPRRVPVLVTG